MRNTAFALVIAVLAAGLISMDAYAREGIKIVSVESEPVAAASGKSISAKSVCPAGTRLISGGGECYGFLNTEGRAALTRSAPVLDESIWVVECTNMNRNAGELQARAWAICADPEILEIKGGK
ncbi:MAG: hypothetical protein RIG61_05375 [Deltaproteobacteria bacterium]